MLKKVSEAPEKIDDLKPKPPVRVYIDGCFDLCHCGHFNAIRQASKLADVLVVGCNSDEEIAKVKGPTILNSKERCLVVDSCRFAGDCIPDTPYLKDETTLDEYNCEFYAHGDDPCYVDGINVLEKLDKIGRQKIFARTPGVSTTDITGRLLKLIGNDIPNVVREAPSQ